MNDRMLNLLRGTVIAAADAVGVSLDELEALSQSRFDTAFRFLTPTQVRSLRDGLQELKHSMTRPVNRYWDRPQRDVQLERKAEALIREDIRKRDGILVGRDPLGRRVGPDDPSEREDA